VADLNPELLSPTNQPNNSEEFDSTQEQSSMRPVTPTAPIKVLRFNLPENEWIKEITEKTGLTFIDPASFDCDTYREIAVRLVKQLLEPPTPPLERNEKSHKLKDEIIHEPPHALPEDTGNKLNGLTMFNIPVKSPSAIRNAVKGLIELAEMVPEVLHLPSVNNKGVGPRLVVPTSVHHWQLQKERKGSNQNIPQWSHCQQRDELSNGHQDVDCSPRPNGPPGI
jgi:hypothetical protein